MPGSPACQRSRPPLGDAAVVAMLTLLFGTQPVTTDLYLPALPTLQRAFGTTVAAAQATLAALIVSFGIAQLLCGPLSDRYGRRPILIGGLAAYTLAALACATAPGIEALVGWRIVQGAALAAAVTCGRSMVRDLYEPTQGARTMSRALSGLGVMAVLSPLVGGALVETAGWRAVLVALAVYGGATLAVVVRYAAETLAVRDANATDPGRVVRNWAAVVADPTFRAWAALSAATYGGLFALLSGSSFVFIGIFGVGRFAFGAIMASISIAYIGGTFLCRRLLARHGLRATVRIGAWFSLIGGATMAALAAAGVSSVWAILLPQYGYAIGHGIHQPCGQAGAIGPFPEKAGTAASLSGFAMTLSAIAVGAWLGRTLDASPLPFALCIGVCGALVALVAWTLVQRHGEPAPKSLVEVAAQPL